MGEPRQPLTTNRRRFASRVRPNDDAQPMQLRRVGKLRLGEKKTSGGGKEFPTETDYFKLSVEEWLPVDMKKSIEERFRTLHGERPLVVDNVFFVAENEEDVFSQNFEMWGGGKLLCHGDGEHAQRRVDDDRRIQAAWRDYGPCANGNCPDFLSGKCGPMNRLRFMLPQVTLAGFFQIDTGSWHSADNITAGLTTIRVLTKQIFGEERITGIPLVLSRAPKKIEHGGKLNTHFLVSLTMAATNYDNLRELVEANAPRPVAQLTAAKMEIPDDELDMPADNIAASEQVPAADAGLMTEIGQLFDSLNTTAGNRAAKLHEYKGREAELRDRLKGVVVCARYFSELQTPREERARLLAEYAGREAELIVKLKGELDTKLEGQQIPDDEPEEAEFV